VVSDELTLFVWDGDRLLQKVRADKTVSYLYEPDSFVPLAQVHSDGGWADPPQGPRAVDPGRQNRHQHLSEAAAADRIYFVSTDHLGTPQELVDEDGKIVWLAKYRAWGRINALDRAEVAQPLRFQGQYEDAETGLY